MAKYERFALRNFDTEPRYPYCYGSEPNDRLESVANAHTAADLHVRPGLSPRWFQGRGRCERLKRYDQAWFPATKMIHLGCLRKQLGVSPNRHAVFAQSCKVLNLYGDSKRKVAVTIRATLKIKIINWSCLTEGEANFQTTRYRYADK
jgi:hypothetical protein